MDRFDGSDAHADAKGAPRPSGFEVALNHIESQIHQGVYVSGKQLPTERDLSAQLGVSRGAVREAIRAYQGMGVLVSATGPGNGTRISPRPGDALGRMLNLYLALESTSVSDLTETRVLIERETARLAAIHRDPEVIAELEEIVAEMDRRADPAAFNELDTAFHITLCRGSGNQLLTIILSAIRTALARPIESAEQRHRDWQQLRVDLLAQHHALLDAVRAGEADRARAISEEHIRHAYGRLLPDAADN